MKLRTARFCGITLVILIGTISFGAILLGAAGGFGLVNIQELKR